MSKQTNLVTTLAALAMTATTAAYAGTDAKASGYDDLDANKDGKISRSEATADPELSSRWNELDQNGDNKLDQGEFARFETEPAPETGSQPGVNDVMP